MLKYLKKYWFFALLAPLFMIGEVSVDLLQPQLMSTIVDEGVLGLSNNGVGDLELVISTGIRMILTVVLGGFFGVMCGVFTNLCSQNFSNDLRKDVFKKVMSLSFSQTDRFSTGSLITRITNDITQLQNLVNQLIRGFIRYLLFFVGGIFCMLRLDLSFGVIVACAFPVILALIIFIIVKVTPLFSVMQKRLDRVNSVVQENVTGSRVVKAYVHEDYEKARFGQANQELVDVQLKGLTYFSYMMPIMNITLNLATVAVIYLGSLRVQAGAVTPGNVMAAITYLSQILNSILMISMIFQSISRGMVSAKRIQEVLDCEPEILQRKLEAEFGSQSDDTENTGSDESVGADSNAESPATNITEVAGTTTSTHGKVEFRNVSFAYPNGNGEEILHDINLTIQPGETLAILGSTGCGKTSMVNLIPRFYDVTEGEVLLDGKNVKDYPLTELRDRIAITLQKSELFSRTIRENILWGRPDATEEELIQAAKDAQAAEFIFAKSEGLDTMVAEKGMSLSGGQKQRLSISRALLKKADVLIFDDSTSALDLKTEANLYDALGEHYPDVTKIIIAQRIASVRRADRIVVLEEGSISACGSHNELMETSSIYQDIYQSQLKTNPEAFLADQISAEAADEVGTSAEPSAQPTAEATSPVTAPVASQKGGEQA